MKRLLIFSTISVLLISCDSQETKTQDDTKEPIAASEYNKEALDSIPTETTPEKAENLSEVEMGKQLISQSDCMSCHQLDAKMVGPAYIDVAKKYANNEKNVEYLATKIIKGGQGVWGSVPMPPHPGISQEDAAKMAKYILSVN